MHMTHPASRPFSLIFSGTKFVENVLACIFNALPTFERLSNPIVPLKSRGNGHQAGCEIRLQIHLPLSAVDVRLNLVPPRQERKLAQTLSDSEECIVTLLQYQPHSGLVHAW